MSEQTTMAQTNMFGVLDQSLNRVFVAKDVKNKDGAVVGVSIGLRKNKEIATDLGLTGSDNKEALLDAILKQRDGFMNQLKREVAGLNGEWTARSAVVKNVKRGRTLVIRLDEVKRSTTLSDEKLAEGMFPKDKYPAMSLEDKLAAIALMRESQKRQLAGETLDIPASDPAANALDETKAEHRAD